MGTDALPSALIGHTGFVGSILQANRPSERLFNSSNVEELHGQQFGLLVCAGAPAVKWKANQDPVADRANIQRLIHSLAGARAEHVVLISTVDVYPSPKGVDETTAIDLATTQPYGRHRRELEMFVQDNFEHTILRLPGLFGSGLQKNIIFDLMNRHRVEKICPDSVFQFYDLARLTEDLDRVQTSDVTLMNLATEPTSVTQIAGEVFDIELPVSDCQPATYDMHTRHASLLDGEGQYIMTGSEVLGRMIAFVAGESETK